MHSLKPKNIYIKKIIKMKQKQTKDKDLFAFNEGMVPISDITAKETKGGQAGGNKTQCFGSPENRLLLRLAARALSISSTERAFG